MTQKWALKKIFNERSAISTIIRPQGYTHIVFCGESKNLNIYKENKEKWTSQGYLIYPGLFSKT